MIYVDEPIYPYGRMMMCHMAADTEEELNQMADKIGVSRRWIQRKRYIHYDICKAKRALAIKNGAKEVSTRELVEILNKTQGRKGKE